MQGAASVMFPALSTALLIAQRGWGCERCSARRKSFHLPLVQTGKHSLVTDHLGLVRNLLGRLPGVCKVSMKQMGAHTFTDWRATVALGFPRVGSGDLGMSSLLLLRLKKSCQAEERESWRWRGQKVVKGAPGMLLPSRGFSRFRGMLAHPEADRGLPHRFKGHGRFPKAEFDKQRAALFPLFPSSLFCLFAQLRSLVFSLGIPDRLPESAGTFM